MNNHEGADVAMRSCRRVQSSLRAMADKDSAEMLRQVNEATDLECRWMVSQLLAQVDAMAEHLARYARRGSTRERVLRAAADGMEGDIATTGAAVVIDEAMRREGLI